jgi:hypothetical protein
MAEIRHLTLFIHPSPTYTHRLLKPAPNIAASTVEIAAAGASDVTTAACII